MIKKFCRSLQNKSRCHLLAILICMQNDIVDRYSINYLLCKLIYLLGNKIVSRLDKRKKMNGLILDQRVFFPMFAVLLVSCDFFHVFNFPGNFLTLFPYNFSRTETSWLYVTVCDPSQIDKAVDFRLLICL